MHFEVEQKYRVENIVGFKHRLTEMGARAQPVIVQVDRYFNHPSRDFYQTDEALRLRRVGDDNFITYKGPKLDAVTKTRREIELPLCAGSSAIDEYAELLSTLGFGFVAEVSKRRLRWQLDWHGQAVEIALDDVAGVGLFVELELPADEHSIEEAKTAIASLADELGLKHSERRSYLELLLEKWMEEKK
jgi:adenylate cyclase, class 2